MNKINLGLIWGAIVATAGIVTYAFDNFVRAEDFDKTVNGFEKQLADTAEDLNEKLEEQQLRTAYGQYYDRLDDYEEALAEDRTRLAAEYLRQMEMLASEICELDPEWERCESE